MGLREIRTLTALAVIGLSGWTMSCGWTIVRFSLANTKAASHEERARAVRPWIGAPGVAAAAMEASLMDAAGPTDADTIRTRSEEFEALLARRPMSSLSWLSLASMRLVSEQPIDRILGALTLSSLTGANEGRAMSQRGIFALWQWESMPADVRKRLAADLAGSMLERAMSSREQMTAYEILAVKSADTRREIADLLRADGLSADDLRRIGL
jgi:hypothetical protein